MACKKKIRDLVNPGDQQVYTLRNLITGATKGVVYAIKYQYKKTLYRVY